MFISVESKSIQFLRKYVHKYESAMGVDLQPSIGEIPDKLVRDHSNQQIVTVTTADVWISPGRRGEDNSRWHILTTSVTSKTIATAWAPL